MKESNIFWNKDFDFFNLTEDFFSCEDSYQAVCNLITELDQPIDESDYNLRFDYIFAKLHRYLVETTIKNDNANDFDLAFIERIHEVITIIGENGMNDSKFNRFLVLEKLVYVLDQVFWYWGNIGTGPHGNGCDCILCQHQ